MEDKYNWRRIKNVRTQSEVFSGILAVGDTGMAMPIEGKTDLNDVVGLQGFEPGTYRL